MPQPSPLHERISALCTSLRWKEWAGYSAVRSYDTYPEREYYALRYTAGLLDISPLFKYEVRGRGAAAFLSWVATRNLHELKQNRFAYTAFCDDDGKVLDDGTVARLGENQFRVTSAGPILHHLQWHSRGFPVELEDASERIAALALQGPTSRQILNQVSSTNLDSLRYFHGVSAELAGAPVVISRTGYTGDLGYEIWIPRDQAVPVWDALMAAGAPHGLLPVGLDALDVARIEAGYSLQDVDYFSSLNCLIESRKSSPYEVGLGWVVHLKRERFLGQEALRIERARGARWSLVGLELSWRDLEALYDQYRLPPNLPTLASRDAVPVFHNGRQVGRATS
ncbi:MAG: aminomethyltransferase family protein, partial [Planctomycetota bacterium]